MAEYVGLQAKSPDVFGTISQLLSIRGQMAQVQQERQTAAQRKGIAEYFANRDPMELYGEDGTVDPVRLLNPEFLSVAGDKAPEVLSSIATLRQQQLQSKGTLLSLNTSTLDAYRGFVGGLQQDPDVVQDNEKGRQKVKDALMQFGDAYGKGVLPVVSAYAKQLDTVPQGKMSQALQIVQMQANDAGKQLEAQRPQYTSTGSVLTDINPMTPGGKRPTGNIPLTISPGAQVEQHTDQLGNVFLTFRDKAGNVTGTTQLGGEGGPARFGPGERPSLEAQAEQNFSNVTANRQAASMVPQQLDQIDKALKLSQETATGSFAGKRADIESALGSLLPTGYQGLDDASKLNELEKLTERIATDASKVLGVNAKTDAERESIHKQNANIGYTPKAIQNVLKYAKAQTLAMQAKGDAQESWLRSEGNGITKQHEFEEKFRKAYDPRVFQFEVMTEKEQDAYLDKLSKEERKTLRDKTRQLMELGAIDAQ